MAVSVNPTAYWNFNETAGSAIDSIGSFTLTNTGGATYVPAKIGNGGELGAANTTKFFLNTTVNNSTYPITVAGWVKPAKVNDDGNIFCLSDNNIHYYQFKFRSSDSHIVFRSNNNTQAADVDTGIVAVVGTWYHFQVVITNTTTLGGIWINGSSTNGSTAIFVATSLTQFTFGALKRATPIQYCSALFDECLFVRGAAYTSADATYLYNGGSGISLSPFPSGTITGISTLSGVSTITL